MKYFSPPYTQEAVDQRYKELAKMYHPDKPGGSVTIMQQINQEKKIADKLCEGMTDVSDILNIVKAVKSKYVPNKKSPKRFSKRRTKSFVVNVDLKDVTYFVREANKLLKNFK